MLMVGAGGFIGAILRYSVSLYMAKIGQFDIPLGTLLVNALGGFLIGAIMEFSLSTELISPELRLFLTTGILGGFTTFSTFSYETVALLSDGAYMLVFLNVVLNLFLSVFGVVLGRLVVYIVI
ncbi:fluoride efflux transporter CrcB [Fervidobacterium riparium]|uniref:fluoride efflux transporter CrcB n=1 Tax=Fervidobacterium gondwanense TaxID=44754 RepID=UPI003C745D4B